MQDFGAWCPDLPAYGGSHATEAKNCIPQTERSYGPLKSLQRLSQAIDYDALGMVSAIDSSGNNYVFAGSSSDLFRLTADGAWDNVRRANIPTEPLPTPNPYALTNEDRWRFVVYRDRVIAAAGLGEKIQTLELGVDTIFEDLADVGTGTPPNAKHVAIARDFAMLGNTYDTVDGAAPSRVWWSAIGDPTTWPTPGSVAAQAVQSDFRDLPGGGAVQAIVPGLGGADAVVFCERRIWRATFVGPPVQFDFQVVDPARGLYAPGAVASNGQIAFYLAEDGWYAFDGLQSTPIGADVIDRWFLAEVDDSLLHKIDCAMDADQKLLWVAYPGPSSRGYANRLLILNWETSRWTHADPGSLTAGDEIQCIAPMRSIGVTLEGLDAFGTLDTLPFSLDSRAWAGGGAYLGAITNATWLCSFSGPALEALVEGPEQTADGTARARTLVQGVRPYIDTGSVFCSIKTRSQPGEAYTQAPFVPVGTNGVAYQRANGRFVRAVVKVPAGTTWTHLQGFDVIGKAVGSR